MSSTKYTYAVARIRALEIALFDASVIEQLLACSTEQQCIQLLQEKGWGDADTPAKAEAILDREQEKAWETIRDLHVDMSGTITAKPGICTDAVRAHEGTHDAPCRLPGG